jgi:ABC-type uncharacterized transport system permease subunit
MGVEVMNAADAVVVSAVVFGVPVLYASLGEVINERAGIFNVGIEGVMLGGAFTAASVFRATGSEGLAVLAAAAAGLLMGLLLAFLYIYRAANQIVTGILFDLVITGLTAVLFGRYFTSAPGVAHITHWRIPGLASLPVIGPGFFNQSPFAYLAFLLVPAVWWLLKRTWFGLTIRSLGQRPQVADSVGISVPLLRAEALLFGCVLQAMGGAVLLIQTGGDFLPGVTAGYGFVALAVVVLGRFEPLLLLPATLLFSLTESIQLNLQILGLGGPPGLWESLPYLVTIVAVAAFKGAQYPAAIAIPFTREDPA